MSKHWKVLDSEELFRSKVFRLRKDRCELPDQRVMPGYYVMEFPDWVHVIPVTTDGQIVMVRQYRHAAEDIFLEVPGGTTDPGEEAQPAAERELLEETGYKAQSWRYLGAHSPNPALQSNKMHTYLALDCKKVAEPDLDPYEDIELELMSIKDVFKALEEGKVQHSLMMASLALARPELLKLVP